MTEYDIDVFFTVVKTGNITKGAKAFSITQSAMSRRIKAIEDELGYKLFNRQKGIQNVELTEQGSAFTTVAEKWQKLWKEAKDIKSDENQQTLNIAAADSVSVTLSAVYRTFLLQHPEIHVSISTSRSYAAYDCMENGNTIDLALISTERYSASIETIPIYTEPMLFVCGKNAEYEQCVHPSELDVTKQIRMRWAPNYEIWQAYWFPESASPRLWIDKMSFFQEFLFWDNNWAILPGFIANQLKDTLGISIRNIKDGPPDRLVYYLIGKRPKPEVTQKFLPCLKQQLQRITGITPLIKDS